MTAATTPAMSPVLTPDQLLDPGLNPHQGDSVLPMLADRANYQACQWDLVDEPERRAYWLGLFREHLPRLLGEGVAEAVDRGVSPAEAHRRSDLARDLFHDCLDAIAAEPTRFGRMDILRICLARERATATVGMTDPFRLAKRRENEAAMAVLPPLLAELDGLELGARRLRLMQGIFAGNIFDLGATKTAALFDAGQSVDFRQVLAKLKPRPWLIDDLDAWMHRWEAKPRHERALLFVDNAGCDILLGMLPFARELLRQGTAVVLTANTLASLNDITHDELGELVARIAAWDDIFRSALRDGTLTLVPSGNGLPLIDFTRVSQALVTEMERRPADLVVIEGMGRSVESNLTVRMTCDTINIAMVKDQGVAEALGGEVYDLVFRYAPGL